MKTIAAFRKREETRISFLRVLLLRFPLVLARHGWRCASCRHVFRSLLDSNP
jgi:hypothetical protein